MVNVKCPRGKQYFTKVQMEKSIRYLTALHSLEQEGGGAVMNAVWWKRIREKYGDSTGVNFNEPRAMWLAVCGFINLRRKFCKSSQAKFIYLSRLKKGWKRLGETYKSYQESKQAENGTKVL